MTSRHCMIYVITRCSLKRSCLSRGRERQVGKYSIVNSIGNTGETLSEHRHCVSMIYMIAGTTPKPHLRSRPHLSYTHYNKTGHELFYIVPKYRSIRDKNAVEWNTSNLHALSRSFVETTMKSNRIGPHNRLCVALTEKT